MAKKSLINSGKPPSSGLKPREEGVPPQDKLWTFSFRFWRQIDKFGFAGDAIDPKWFVSLLDQLNALSDETVDDFRRLRDSHKSKGLRYHQINWQQHKIPLQRKDFTWLPEAYLRNESEFPFVQIQISTGKGRIAGFWDDQEVFQILLLDPLHNLQPSKDFNYKVDPCSPLRNQFQSLQHALHAFRAEIQDGCAGMAGCVGSRCLPQLLDQQPGEAVICLGQAHWQDASGLIQSGHISAIDDLFAFALLMAREQPERLRELAGC